MCGIFCCVSKGCKVHSCISNSKLITLLQNRGPNSTQIKEYANIIFGGFVLWHQGIEICTQPLESERYILLLNGDIFNLNHFELQGKSDSEWIFEKLSNTNSENDIFNIFKLIEGPYSIILYDKVNKTLYFGRDSLGRNSLLIENNSNHFRLLSTSCNNGVVNNIMELPPLGIYKASTDDFRNSILYPWKTLDEDCHNQLEQLQRFCKINIIVTYSFEIRLFSNVLTHEKLNYNFYNIVDNIRISLSTSDLYELFLNDDDFVKTLNKFSQFIEESVKKRVQCTAKFCSSCLNKKNLCNHSKIAILFSGGIDCSILAVLCDKFIPQADSIDLVNVAFERTGMLNSWDVPDRISAKSSFMELKVICPNRTWNFIEVNVNKKELHEHLSEHIKHLIYPLDTVLDESIGCAFWFASRAIGFKEGCTWKSSARVVILGTGADELFGGYVRHKNAYVRHHGTEEEKQENLHKELEKDWNRIPSRNLARDDRVISDNGKTPRAPFIEENLVKFVRSLKPNQRCCFLLEDGIGDKLFLRLYGYRIGLKGAAFLKKRAIQFGSRIANKKQNAADRSIYLVNSSTNNA